MHNGAICTAFPQVVKDAGVEAAGVQDRATGWNMSLSSYHPFPPQFLCLLVQVGKKALRVNPGLASEIKSDSVDLEATNECVKIAVRAMVLAGRMGRSTYDSAADFFPGSAESQKTTSFGSPGCF